jgi:hypothetical protein
MSLPKMLGKAGNDVMDGAKRFGVRPVHKRFVAGQGQRELSSLCTAYTV